MKGVALALSLTAAVVSLSILMSVNALEGKQKGNLRERLQRNLVRNGDFERGLEGWSTEHYWYARGEGLSRWEVDEKIVKSGNCSVKVIGRNNRGIAIQDLRPHTRSFTLHGLKVGQDYFVALVAVDVDGMRNETKPQRF